MEKLKRIELERKAILGEMESIRSAERATLKEQMLPVKHKGKKEPVLRGPYYVLARWEKGKTRSRRVSKKELARVRTDVKNHLRLRELYARFEELTEQMGRLEQQCQAADEAVKKGLKLRSSKAPKSRE